MSSDPPLQPLQPLRLQVGGTINPRRHLYIERREDAELLTALLDREYCNILSSRQMGKSSLMVRACLELQKRNVRFASIDIAGELGGEPDAETWYLGLISKIGRDLGLDLDPRTWWASCDGTTPNQRLMQFFRETAQRFEGPVVIFLDEIDSTLRLPFTDDLFTAIRSMYNERAWSSIYEQITFCLLGVASPNELIRDRRTTPFNIGRSLELHDFDPRRDDLSLLAEALHSDLPTGRLLLERVLYWTGGHPYLTVKLCETLRRNQVQSQEEVDGWIHTNFRSLERLGGDVHFQQILRFLETRVADGLATFRLYSQILHGRRASDENNLTHVQLKLSGLVKRNDDGNLVVRNRIYERLFDGSWVLASMPRPTSLRNYRIDGEIGVGRSGPVYRAFDEDLRRWVALKQLTVKGWGKRKENELQNVRRGIRAAARLDHPSIVRIFDLIDDDRGDWLVMELVEGKNLSEVSSKGRPMRLEQALSVARDLAAGLAHAHQEGIVHRDLRSRNILFTPAGRAKILGFGEARSFLGEETDHSTSSVILSDELDRMTAPEQLQGKRADHLSDLFALGVLLYEILAGRPPFVGSTVYHVVQAIARHEPTKLRRVNPRVSREVEQLVHLLLAKNPSHRPQNALDVSVLLDQIEAERRSMSADSNSGFQDMTHVLLRARAEALLLTIDARGFKLDRTQRARILNTSEIATLDRWLRRAVNADSIEDVLK